jgi:hypothetical protein
MSIDLKSLVGEHELSGVDMVELKAEGPYGDDASVCVFCLDGKTYTAKEDPDDGYRSYLGELIEGGTVRNMFAPQRVLCSMTEGDDEILVMRDLVTGKDVLSIGTDNAEDYYPSFVANFQPENMACNAPAPGKSAGHE